MPTHRGPVSKDTVGDGVKFKGSPKASVGGITEMGTGSEALHSAIKRMRVKSTGLGSISEQTFTSVKAPRS